MIYFLYLVNVFNGAWLGRMWGGGKPSLPRWLKGSLIMSYFVLGCYPFAHYYAIIAALGIFGVSTGHGQYFLARIVKTIEPEKVDPIVTLFFGKDPRTLPSLLQPTQNHLNNYGMTKLYWRCVFGMFVTGQLVGLPAMVLAIIFHAWIPALFFSLTGLAKAISYIISYKIWKNTEGAEWINGGLRTALALTVFII